MQSRCKHQESSDTNFHTRLLHANRTFTIHAAYNRNLACVRKSFCITRNGSLPCVNIPPLSGDCSPFSVTNTESCTVFSSWAEQSDSSSCSLCAGISDSERARSVRRGSYSATMLFPGSCGHRPQFSCGTPRSATPRGATAALL